MADGGAFQSVHVAQGLWVRIELHGRGIAQITIWGEEGACRRLSAADARQLAADLQTDMDAEDEDEQMAGALIAAASTAETLSDDLVKYARPISSLAFLS
ncbi:MAG TPA: hypothetical protein VIJ94_12075 [Caulobacteraceae bacterium]